jgi:polysaccharide export outer membrane protein
MLNRFFRPGFRSVLFLSFAFFCSCRTYNQSILFKTDGEIIADQLAFSKAAAEKNYVIKPNDYLDVRVYTNKGERILDPNGEFARSLGIVGGTQGAPASRASQRGGQAGGQQGQLAQPQFLVEHDGYVKLPMVDKVKLSGYTLSEADSILQLEYAKFYVDSYVITQVTNNRVFVLGAIGGASGASGGTVVPLQNDNMNLIEVLAQVGGIPQTGKAYNIRLIRGELSNPAVQLIDLTTIEGMRKASLQVEPNDIVYVEPVRRVFLEAFRDISPIIGTLSSLATLYYIIVIRQNVR